MQMDSLKYHSLVHDKTWEHFNENNGYLGFFIVLFFSLSLSFLSSRLTAVTNLDRVLLTR